MPGLLDEPDDLATSASKSASPPISFALRKAVLQVAHQRIRIVAEQDGAHARVALRDQDRAERALADREADLGVGAAGAEGRRRHAEHGVRRLVEAAVRVEPGVVDRLGHRRLPAKLGPAPSWRDAPTA